MSHSHWKQGGTVTFVCGHRLSSAYRLSLASDYDIVFAKPLLCPIIIATVWIGFLQCATRGAPTQSCTVESVSGG